LARRAIWGISHILRPREKYVNKINFKKRLKKGDLAGGEEAKAGQVSGRKRRQTKII
jgi:hypothetical protein